MLGHEIVNQFIGEGKTNVANPAKFMEWCVSFWDGSIAWSFRHPMGVQKVVVRRTRRARSSEYSPLPFTMSSSNQANVDVWSVIAYLAPLLYGSRLCMDGSVLFSVFVG